jgi:hypothetical protein
MRLVEVAALQGDIDPVDPVPIFRRVALLRVAPLFLFLPAFAVIASPALAAGTERSPIPSK